MLYEDKITEQSPIILESRQVFWIFVVAVVVVSLIFGLGVVVGQRMVKLMDPPPPIDPIELLGQLEPSAPSAVEIDQSLTFAQTLTTPPNKPVTAGLSETNQTATQASVATDPQISGSSKSVVQKTPAPDLPIKPGTFALQLSSFQNKIEADTFAEKLRKDGLRPQITSAEVAGKGLWYRVRVGQYGSWDQALKAKIKIERDHSIIAYIAKN